MPTTSLNLHHLSVQSAADVREVFRLLDYDVDDLYAYEGDELDAFEFDDSDGAVIRRVYIIGRRDRHTVYLFEVDDLRQARLRGLAWNILQRSGTALLVVTRDYREVLFADPRLVGGANKSSVRVSKLKMLTGDPTRHDLDTLNAIHAHRRTGAEVYAAQAEAFNVTTITNRFYREYKTYYDRARQAAVQYNPGIREFYDPDKLHAFTQRLLGRLMFLYFLQRKGWLGGRQKFLTDQFRAVMRAHVDEVSGDQETFYYYREVLEPLFFETLNQKRPDNLTRWQGLRIPYLNGGLFDRDRDPQAIITLPDSLFDPDSSDGVLAFFNRYNFTVADDTPLEQDVAVDPEMLGKVFENMLEERDRGQSGSFYTPRAIVSYMCQEALAGYLEESAGIPRETVRAIFDPDAAPVLLADEAERVNTALDTLTVLDPAVGSGSFLIGMMGEIIRLRAACYFTLTAPTLNPSPKMREGLEDAPDSPSLPVEEDAGAWGTPPPALLADWKETIIRDTLYGVDIKPEAIEIAQLRLWLALVVDQTLDQARPLPNLDYRLMAGNSLIETVDGQPVLGELAARMLQTQAGTAEWQQVNDQLKLFDPNPVQARMTLFESDRESLALPELRERFFRAAPDERKTLREEIAALERRIVFAGLKERADGYQTTINQIGKKAAQTGGRLSAADKRRLEETTTRLKRITDVEEELKKPHGRRPFFLYRLHFSEVFAAKGGFDVVIANPPYVRQELIGDQKPELEAAYPAVYAGTADLYVYFFARSFSLLRPKGVLSFITPNKFMRANYGRKLRGYLAEKVRLHTLIDFGDLPIFDATTYPMITLASKQPPAKLPSPSAAFGRGAGGEGKITVLQITTLAEAENLPAAVEHAFRLPQNTLTDEGWQLSSPRVRAVMDKLANAGVSLGEYVDNKFYRGITTGLNEAFIIDEAQRAELIAADPNSANIIKPYLRGRDVKRWQVEWNHLYLIFTRRGINIDDYPAIRDYLLQFKDRLMPGIKGGRKPGLYEWYEIQDSIAYYPEFEKPKIVWAKYGIDPAFAYETEHQYTGNTVFILPTDDLYIFAVFNSRVVQWYAWNTFNLVRGGYIEWIPTNVGQLPIPDAPPELREQIAALARRCLDAAALTPKSPLPKARGLAELEAELNALVYRAYGLDDDDIAVIEGSLGSPALNPSPNPEGGTLPPSLPVGEGRDGGEE